MRRADIHEASAQLRRLPELAVRDQASVAAPVGHRFVDREGPVMPVIFT